MGRLRELGHRWWGGGTTSIDDVRPRLWTDVDPQSYAEAGERYQSALLEQYKSTWRWPTGSAHAARSPTPSSCRSTPPCLPSSASSGRTARRQPRGCSPSPWSSLLGESLTWFWLVRSYRQLNAAKYVVVGALEERLPVSPYWRAEWKALGEGRDRSKYWPITHLEQSIPILFAAAYLAGFVIILLER